MLVVPFNQTFHPLHKYTHRICIIIFLTATYHKVIPFIPDFKSAPVAGEIVVARFDMDNRWYRSRIIDTSPDSVNREYTVYLVDYGANAVVNLVNLRVIQPEFLHLPFQVL